MKFKKNIVLLLLVLIITALPLTVSATDINKNNTPFNMTFECKIGGTVPENTVFTFGVTERTLTIANGFDVKYGEEKSLSDFNVDTKTATDGKLNYTFPEIAFSGGLSYTFKLKSVSNSLSVVSPLVIIVDFKTAEGELAIEGRILPDASTEVPIDSFGDQSTALITVDCQKLSEVTLSTEGCEAITKVYDGKLDAVVTDKNFKLLGIQDGHDVNFSFEKAEYDNPDVKKATKVILSGLKLTGNDAAKYGFASSTLELKATITPRPITVTADNLVMSLGTTPPQLTYTLSEELLPGNTATGELERVLGNKVGDYAITIGTLFLGDNYSVTFIEGKLTISSFGFFQVLDRNSSVKIAGYFNPEATISASALDPNSETYSILATSASWGKIISAYDVKFTSDGYDGSITVYLPVDDTFTGKEITVYQQKHDNSIACYKVTATGGYAPIETNECTQFMLVTEKDEVKKSEGSVAWKILKVIIIILSVIIGLGLVIALFFFGMIFFNKTAELKKIIKVIKKLFKK